MFGPKEFGKLCTNSPAHIEINGKCMGWGCGLVEDFVRTDTLKYLDGRQTFEEFSNAVIEFIHDSLKAVEFINYVKGLKEIQMCPFTTPAARDKMLEYIATGVMPEAGIEVGDKCFIKYRDMMIAWNAEPRWTTAHNIYKKMRMELPTIEDGDEAIAYDLAWQVFFNLHVMKYEIAKREQNGEVIP